MKELSIEEKAKAYDEAIRYAHYLINERCKEGTDGSFHRADLDKMFPELAESDDERIRKGIIRCVKGNMPDNDFRKKYIAWLEKQGEQPKKHDVCDNCDQQGCCVSPCPMKLVEKQAEQKPVNKVEPKFHEGDFILNGDLTDDGKTEIFRVLKVCDTWYDVENIYDSRHTIITFKQEYSCRVWNTIQDAKDGDVLVEDSCIFIVQKLDDNYTSAKTYCTLYDDGDFDNGTILFFDIDSTKPATKEQRDLLFQKMHEAGYEWDADKKELKKIERKPIEPDDIIEESYQQQANDLIDMVTEKPAWSEEDEYKYNTILHHLDLRKEKFKKECNQEEQDRYQCLYDWLKSLRPQSQWKPSDEQMEAMQKALFDLCGKDEHNIITGLYYDLKKLREE